MVLPSILQTIENLKIENGKRMAAVLGEAARGAFTERQLADMPAIFFHVTVMVANERVSVCHGFGPVFEAFGMDRLLWYLPV